MFGKLVVLFLSLIGLLTSGCSLDFAISDFAPGSVGGQPQSISITQPQSGDVFNDSKVSLLQTGGYCTSGENQVVLELRQRLLVDCVDGQWKLNIEMNRLPEGENTIKLYDLSGNPIGQTTFVKKYMPSYVFYKKQMRDISTFSQVSYSPEHNTSGAMVYISDEYCIVIGCATKNIVLRLEQDNYVSKHYVTNDLSESFSWPRVVQTSKSELTIYYIGKMTTTSSLNILYKKFYLDTKTFSPQYALTNLPADSLKNTLQLEQTSDGKVFISYISQEYCAENACGLDRVALRTSDDHFLTRTDFGTTSSCNIDVVRSTVQKNNQDYHLFWNYQRGSGTCTNWQTYLNHAQYNGASWSAVDTFTNGRNPGSLHFAVDNNGNRYVFHHTTWEAGCTGWGLYYGSSIDNFASTQLVAGGCQYQHSYPDETHRPSTVIGDDGQVYLLSARRGTQTPGEPPHHLFISSSSDGFSSAKIFYESYFASWTPGLWLTRRNGNFLAIAMLGASSHSGLNIFPLTSSWTTSRHQLNGPGDGLLQPVALDNEKIGIIGQSDSWCKRVSKDCENNNFYMDQLESGVRTWLTQIKAADSQLSNAHYWARPAMSDYFIYASNESDPQRKNSRYKTSSDDFLSSVPFASIDSTTVPIISTTDLDASGVVHAAGAMGKAYYYNSSDGFSSYTQINTDSLGGAPGNSAVNKTTGEYVVSYGSNGTGWKGRIRWSVDGFGSDLYISSDSGIKYGGWTPIWRPNGEAEILLLTDSDSDSKVDIGYLSSTDGFSSLSTKLSFANKTVCRSLYQSQNASSAFLNAKFDGLGRLYILYSAMDVGDSTCKLYLKRSDDWSSSWPLKTVDNNSLEPYGLFLRTGQLPIACAKSLSSLHCFDVASITRVND